MSLLFCYEIEIRAFYKNLTFIPFWCIIAIVSFQPTTTKRGGGMGLPPYAELYHKVALSEAERQAEEQGWNTPDRVSFASKDQAVRVAQIFMHHPYIHGVELFGSVARDGLGHDLDLILITDKGRGSDFICLASDRFGRRDSLETEDLTLQRMECYNTPDERAKIAKRVLGGNFGELLAEAKRYTAAKLDIFVFPPDWRDHLRVLQEDLPHRDPNFMENIARDAVRIA